MKQYLLKFSGAALLLSLVAVGALAQQENNDAKPRKKTESSDMIIVTTKDGKDAKVTVEVKDGEVKVNGKPLSEFKDDNVTVTRRKSLEAITVTGRPSRFRSGTWSYSDDAAPFALSMGENKSFLGVTTDKEGDGAKITEISEGSAAQKAGLKEGDIIIRINDQKVTSPEDLSKAVGKYKPEEKVTVVYKRDGKEQSQSVVLGKRNGFSGVRSFNFDHDFNYSAPNMIYGTGSRGKLGIKAQETEDSKGVKVLDVDDESPADKAGIKEGDIITEFDGAEINNVDKLREVARTAIAKPSFKVKLTRDGKSQEIQVKIPKNLKTTNL